MLFGQSKHGTAWAQGYDVATKGGAKDVNPYDPGLQHDQWNKGFAAAGKRKGVGKFRVI